jgi:hypothetical protein
MSAKQESAHWDEGEVSALVDYLCEHRSEAGDGGSFKASTFNAAAEAIQPFHKSGPPKTSAMCKRKWQSVSDPPFVLFTHPVMHFFS